jgi:2-methylisocitrate lyase-like PEP mutase family enzyme
MTDRAAELRRLHDAPELLVLVNVWDVASARTVAAQPGCRAIATASHSIAAAKGRPDGEGLDRDAMLTAVGAIAAAVELPVTADLERGYGDTPEAVAETMRAAAELGVAGCNIEDSVAGGALRDRDDAVERVRAAAGAGLVVNARTDAFLTGGDGAFDAAVERGRAYLDAGAHCIFVPGVSDRETIVRLAGAIGPISVFCSPASPPLAELESIGVRRASFGPGPMGVAMAALAEAAQALLAHGGYPDTLRFRP